MLVYLNQNSETLNFLLDVDKSARISFGNFPYVLVVSVFGRKITEEWDKSGENLDWRKNERGAAVNRTSLLS